MKTTIIISAMFLLSSVCLLLGLVILFNHPALTDDTNTKMFFTCAAMGMLYALLGILIEKTTK